MKSEKSIQAIDDDSIYAFLKLILVQSAIAFFCIYTLITFLLIDSL